MHFLIYSRRLREFNNQVALTSDITHVVLTSDITHVVEIIMILDEHIEKLFFYVTRLNQYFIVMSLSWLRRHVVDVNFALNILIMFSFFYFAHCCQTSVKIYDTTREKKEFLSFKKSQQIWKLQDQENSIEINHVSMNFVSSLKRTSSILVTHKKHLFIINNLITHRFTRDNLVFNRLEKNHSIIQFFSNSCLFIFCSNLISIWLRSYLKLTHKWSKKILVVFSNYSKKILF